MRITVEVTDKIGARSVVGRKTSDMPRLDPLAFHIGANLVTNRMLAPAAYGRHLLGGDGAAASRTNALREAETGPLVRHYGVAALDIMVERFVKIVFALEPMLDMTATVTARMIPRMTAYSTRAAPSSFFEKPCTEFSNLRIILASG
jgi:hypothetical protein